MIHGFNLEDDLVCEGIIGDGCGGGRIFTVKDETLFAYDPQTKSYISLLDNLEDILKITKDGCIITLESKNDTLYFDLSLLKKI